MSSERQNSHTEGLPSLEWNGIQRLQQHSFALKVGTWHFLYCSQRVAGARISPGEPSEPLADIEDEVPPLAPVSFFKENAWKTFKTPLRSLRQGGSSPSSMTWGAGGYLIEDFILIFILPCGLYFIFHFQYIPLLRRRNWAVSGNRWRHMFILRWHIYCDCQAGSRFCLVNVVEYEKGNYISLGDLLTAMTTSIYT